jgi:hypothetical protein
MSLKMPLESADYWEKSRYVRTRLEKLFNSAIAGGDNEIRITTNLRQGLPLSNVNQLAGAFIEAWAQERLELVMKGLEGYDQGDYQLLAVENGERGGLADIMLRFGRGKQILAADVDVKATAADIPGAGKGPNVTSYAKIRNQYLADPDYIFIILAVEHTVRSRPLPDGKAESVMKVASCRLFDLKAVADKDLVFNPSLGHGQLQIRQIQHMEVGPKRTTADFCALLDAKYVASKGEAALLELAEEKGWLVSEEPVEEVFEHAL